LLPDAGYSQGLRTAVAPGTTAAPVAVGVPSGSRHRKTFCVSMQDVGTSP
jgi:hypothetical protein